MFSLTTLLPTLLVFSTTPLVQATPYQGLQPYGPYEPIERTTTFYSKPHKPTTTYKEKHHQSTSTYKDKHPHPTATYTKDNHHHNHPTSTYKDTHHHPHQTPPAHPHHPPSHHHPQNYTQSYSYGCYTEPSQSQHIRALTGPSYTNYTSMTLDECEYYCTGYPLWGVEYSGECYCGHSLSQGSFPTFPTDCQMTCPGDGSEFCGGGNRLSLYGSEPHPPPVQANPHPAVYDYHYLGCWTEGRKGRALRGASVTSEVYMTVERCGNYCIDSGFTIFGLEYGSECYCGNELARGSYVAYPPECDMACSGDEKEGCGGPNRLSLYHWV